MGRKEPNYNKLCVYDTETTGISPNYIISLAYIAVENNKIVDKGMIICNPDYPISEGASKVNGFTYENTKDKPLVPEEWEKIKHHFEDAILIAHNSSFDVRALNLEFERYHLPKPEFYVCDTCANAKKLIKKGTAEGQVINYKLGTLCEFFNIKLSNWHHADADTEACMKVFNELVKLSNGNLEIE